MKATRKRRFKKTREKIEQALPSLHAKRVEKEEIKLQREGTVREGDNEVIGWVEVEKTESMKVKLLMFARHERQHISERISETWYKSIRARIDDGCGD